MTNQNDPWTVGKILQWTTEFFKNQDVPSARLDAEVLVAHALSIERVDLYVRYNMPLGEQERGIIRDLIRQRAKEKTPVAYLVGYREFYGVKLTVSPTVLIPRPCTEALVDATLDHLKSKSGRTRVLDIGTGSGAIALAVAKQFNDASLVATDLCDDALKIAIENARTHDLESRVEFRQGSMLTPLRVGETFDVIVSNPPYIDPQKRDNLMPDVRDHEPDLALYAKDNGLRYIQHLLDEAPNFLNDGGALILELAPEEKIVQTLREQTQNPKWAEVSSVLELDGHPIGMKFTVPEASTLAQGPS